LYIILNLKGSLKSSETKEVNSIVKRFKKHNDEPSNVLPILFTKKQEILSFSETHFEISKSNSATLTVLTSFYTYHKDLVE